MNNKYTLIEHPLLETKMTIIRDKETKEEKFRNAVNEMTSLLAFEATKNLHTIEKIVETPLTTFNGVKLSEDVVIAPILRAGLSMVDSMLGLIPHAKVAHIGLYRDDNLEAKEYYLNLPKHLDNAFVIITDPMLATGVSLIKAIDLLKEKSAKRIIYIGILGTPVGIKNVHDKHPDVEIYLAAVDEKLNENGYIVPGLGDAGDRLYGTLKW